MIKLFRSKYMFIAVRILIGAIFISASWYKIRSPGAFAHEIYNYKILPVWTINPLAIVLPWIQFFSGVAVLCNVAARGAVVWLLGMMFVFQLAVASALIRGINISCGCFESGGAPATWLTFGRDSLIFAGVILLAFLMKVRGDDAAR